MPFAPQPGELRCSNCKTPASQTPMMRKGPKGERTLCNACGLMWTNKGVLRNPQDIARRQVRSRCCTPPCPYKMITMNACCSRIPYLLTRSMSKPYWTSRYLSDGGIMGVHT